MPQAVYVFRVGVYRTADLPTNGGDISPDRIMLSMSSDPFKIGFADFSPVHPLVPGSRTFTDMELAFFKKHLTTPAKIQTFLDALPMNQEIIDDVCLSPIDTLRQNHAHCIEGAMLAAYLLSLQGFRPMLMDLRSSVDDDDHNITLFQEDGRWGALSVTNHCVLRYMPPIFETTRQLAMAHVNEYMNSAGVHTLRCHSEPVHLAAAFGDDWHTARGDVYPLADLMDEVPHSDLVEEKHIVNLRDADPFVQASAVQLREWLVFFAFALHHCGGRREL